MDIASPRFLVPKNRKQFYIGCAIILILLFLGIVCWKWKNSHIAENLYHHLSNTSKCLKEERNGLLFRLEANITFISPETVELTAPVGCTPFRHRARIATVGDPYDRVISSRNTQIAKNNEVNFTTVFYLGDWIQYFQNFEEGREEEAQKFSLDQGTLEAIFLRHPNASLSNALVTFYGTETIYFYEELPYIQSVFIWQ